MTKAHQYRLQHAIERLSKTDEPPVDVPLETAEECARLMWEVVGHFSDDVGTQGYEYNLIVRARELAVTMQAAVLLSVADRGLSVVARLADAAEDEAEA